MPQLPAGTGRTSETRRYDSRDRYSYSEVGELRQYILAEAYNSRYFIHPSATKMYRDMLEVYWWNGMKRDIAYFVSKCPNCQKVKVEHQKPGGMTQEIHIPA